MWFYKMVPSHHTENKSFSIPEYRELMVIGCWVFEIICKQKLYKKEEKNK